MIEFLTSFWIFELFTFILNRKKSLEVGFLFWDSDGIRILQEFWSGFANFVTSSSNQTTNPVFTNFFTNISQSKEKTNFLLERKGLFFSVLVKKEIDESGTRRFLIWSDELVSSYHHKRYEITVMLLAGGLGGQFGSLVNLYSNQGDR